VGWIVYRLKIWRRRGSLWPIQRTGL